MLIASLFTSLQTALGSARIEAQTTVAPVQEASVLETSPHSFQDAVPLGEVESYTLSFTEEVSDVAVGTATLVEADTGLTHLYLETNQPYVEATLSVGTCEEPLEEVARFEPPVTPEEPLVVSRTLEELLHPRLTYLLQVDTETGSYCAEL